MRIVDTFPYFNEKELLEFRIKYLQNTIDYFIICDGNRTQSGIEKDFSAKKTLKELNLLSENITVLEVDMPSIEEEPNSWNRERMQRNAAADYIDEDTIAFVSDCDEIIDKNLINYFVYVASENYNNILRVPLIYLNCRADLRVHDEYGDPRLWNVPFFALHNHVERYTLSEIRESYAMERNDLDYQDIFITEDDIMKMAGWHFSWMGNSERLKQKCLSSMHVHDDVSDVVAPFGSKEMLEFMNNYEPKENETDMLGRKNHILKAYDTSDLPKEIFELENVRKFLLP